jgi:hypothetical protein
MLLSLLLAVFGAGPSRVQIVEARPNTFELRVNDKPFFVRGAGAGVNSFRELAGLGANSIRTWGVDEKTKDILDAAERNQLKVTVGFWMRKADGFSYRDPAQRATQQAEFRKWVRMYRNHPALLMWAVGNEVELGGEWPEIWPQTEALAKIVKTEDPNHPVIGVYADMWPDKMKALVEECPSLDALGINSYDGLPSLNERMGLWKKPYFVTEYQFSIPTTLANSPWAGTVEPSSAEKAASTRENYEKRILAYPGRVLGSYFFYWGPSGVGSAAMHTTHLNTGEWLPVVRIMASQWGGKVPANRAPEIRTVPASRVARLETGGVYTLKIQTQDPDGDPVTTRYELLPNDPSKRFVGDFEKNLGVISRGVCQPLTTITLPKEPGLYRILLVATDGKGAAATHSISLRLNERN